MSDIASNVKRHEKSRMSKQGSGENHGVQDSKVSSNDDGKRMEELVQLKMSAEHTQSTQNADVAGDSFLKMRNISTAFRNKRES